LAVGVIVSLIGTVFSSQKLITDMWHDGVWKGVITIRTCWWKQTTTTTTA
jgi:hypothetical protein